MNILFVTPEVTPFARAGGLGDVSHYLPRALADRGHRLWVITPKYRQVESAGCDPRPKGPPIQVPLSLREKTAQVLSLETDGGIEIIFLGCDELYNRAGLYGNEYGDYEDNAERFIFFSRAVLECVKALDLAPDVIHCHDWPSGLVPIYTRTLYKDLPQLARAATLFTFHNLGSQGIFWHYDYAMTGLGWELFTPEGLEFHGQLNMTKAGLIGADLVSTVSRKYAQEVLTSEYAFGLEGVLQTRRNDLRAVLNGVDYTVWDPARDPDIAANYTPDKLEGKALCRQDLARAFSLDQDDSPIVAVVSRMLDRKGFDLLSAAMERLLNLDMKMIFMGNGEDRYHAFFNELARSRSGRIGLKVTYDRALSHQIIAGADVFLMPSRYEPCGLEQLYALKYGTVPVVRATGGLDDTVDDGAEHPETGTGFKFDDYTPDALHAALAAAVERFKDREAWRRMMLRGMALDFSWSRAAEEYEALYRQALEKSAR